MQAVQVETFKGFLNRKGKELFGKDFNRFVIWPSRESGLGYSGISLEFSSKPDEYIESRNPYYSPPDHPNYKVNFVGQYLFELAELVDSDLTTVLFEEDPFLSSVLKNKLEGNEYRTDYKSPDFRAHEFWTLADPKVNYTYEISLERVGGILMINVRPEEGD